MPPLFAVFRFETSAEGAACRVRSIGTTTKGANLPEGVPTGFVEGRDPTDPRRSGHDQSGHLRLGSPLRPKPESESDSRAPHRGNQVKRKPGDEAVRRAGGGRCRSWSRSCRPSCRSRWRSSARSRALADEVGVDRDPVDLHDHPIESPADSHRGQGTDVHLQLAKQSACLVGQAFVQPVDLHLVIDLPVEAGPARHGDWHLADVEREVVGDDALRTG